VVEGWSLKRLMPRGLLGRGVIIIVAPIVLLVAIIAYVFFERDLDTTTRRLARDVAADMAMLVALEDNTQSPMREKLRALSARQLDYRIQFLPGQNLPPFHGRLTSTIDVALDDILEQRIGKDRDFRTERIGNDFEIRVDVRDGVLAVLVPRDRVTVSKPDIFILWMVGSSLLLGGIAFIFLRNQVRPIERLARAAGAGFQALWRHRSAPSRPGLHHHARAYRAPCHPAHRNAGGGEPRYQNAFDADEAHIGDDAGW
jgi:two-component system osmolarity sensor histidine kinase EnvZ